MEMIMPYVQVKQKYQITIPAMLRKKLGIHEGDTLEANIEDGHIVFTPQEIIKRGTKEKVKSNLSSYIGAGKGLFSSAEEADEFIRKERDLWD